VRDLMACKYMKNHIGKEFKWVVWGVIGSGIFVELENTIEWYVELNDRFWKADFIFDVEIMTLENQITWQKYTIWNEVTIIVTSVIEDEGKINFEIA
jgi:exoribonuclease R